MPIERELRKISDDCGIDYFGVADLAPARDAILKQGGPEIASYPRAVTIGIALPDAIVDMLERYRDRDAGVYYNRFGYVVVNDRLDATVFRLSSAIQKAGHKALPLPASKRIDDKRICAAFSHKMAAHLAGLGWIGKSCLLVTPDRGPRVRWCSVLTDAPLAATGTPMEERCGECRKCVDICPRKAFTGQPFREDEERETRYAASLCDGFLKELKAAAASEDAVCGLCLYICPHGKK
jgi:epoxyqueuosine reductase